MALLAPCAHADTVGLHLASVHVPQRQFNNVNPGLYYRSDAGWTVGGYRNSLRRTSVYGGYTLEYGPLALTAGAVTGYQDAVQAMLVPSLRLFTHEGVSARLAYIPRVEKRISSNVWHLMVERCIC
ncbi:MAG: hypothetical protein AD742_06980 [Methylibium sp. NZG]|nr:MAG: hypothetical protein AD742_06980 [Methylibium sp. NZG]